MRLPDPASERASGYTRMSDWRGGSGPEVQLGVNQDVDAEAEATRRPLGREWVGIAANARSGLGSGRAKVERLARALERLGLAARIVWTPEARADLVVEAGADHNCRCVVAAGGDGTVAALVNEQPGVPIT